MVILDTGPLVAFLVRRDAHHAWATNLWKELPAPLWTCEPVLMEAAYLSGKPVEIMELVTEGILRVSLELEEQSASVAELLRRYGPRMDFADACVVRMSEIFRHSKVLTTDRGDFSFYRRNKRDVIPLLAPER